MDKRFENQINEINLEALDDHISGLLAVYSAKDILLEKEGVVSFQKGESNWCLVGLLAGDILLHDGIRQWDLEAGQILALKEGMLFGMHASEESHVFCLELAGYVAESLLGREEGSGLLFDNCGRHMEKCRNDFLQGQEESSSVSPQKASAIAYALFMDLQGMEHLGKKKEAQLPWVVEASVSLMQQEYAFLDGIGDLAERLEVSQEYLTRAFRKHLGITPAKYLNSIRIQQAKHMLLDKDFTVSLVADACGFSNANYFAKIFKAETGLTPKEYARQERMIQLDQNRLTESYFVL